MPRFFALVTLLCLLFSSGCSYFRLPVLQGNIVDYEKAEQLRLGMTPSQVEFLLGTPLIQDSFGAPRWDYVVYYRSPEANVLQKNLSVYFENDQVSRIEGREELLADWRKQQALIDKVKKKKELLETPHPGQMPANATGAPADAAGNEDEHAVLPPRDPDTREEILGEESETADDTSDESVPRPPASSESDQPMESSQDQSSTESSADSPRRGDSYRQGDQEDYPEDMSTIYR